MFRLTKEEKNEVVTICDHLAALKFSPNLPSVFTEYGALMLANVLRSKRAVMVSIEIVRAFVRLREAILGQNLSRRLDELEKKYDRQFKIVFDAIRELMMPPEKPKRRIGFHR